MRLILSIAFILFLGLNPLTSQSDDTQTLKLAQQYFRSGEYEKASSLFQKLAEKNTNSDYYFNNYVECLINLEEYDLCEKTIARRLKKKPQSIQLYVSFGNLYERQYKVPEAEAQYEKAISKLTADRTSITQLARAFTSLTKYDLAIQTYTRGSELLKDDSIFAYSLGDMYRRKGETKMMIANYLHCLKTSPNLQSRVKGILQQTLEDEDYIEVQTQLYDFIQKEKNNPVYPDMLAWVFIQRKDYKNALRQVKALDRQLNETGNRVYQLAQIAKTDKNYDVAISGYEYIVAEKGRQSSLYMHSKRKALWCKKQQIVDGYAYTMDDLRVIEAEYETFLDEHGYNSSSAALIKELAEFEAIYINDLDKAISLLKQVIGFAGTPKTVMANAKLGLADYYLMQGERWESTLLYSQVDKQYKNDILGHEARYRNARLYYFHGDFEYAQKQFDVLKASTSKLIANDALDLSVFITDNMGLDTTTLPLVMYADAELLVFQNRFDDAFAKLDSLVTTFPKHTLEDDVLYLKAQIYVKKKDYATAVKLYDRIIADFGEEIKADNSIYELAELYETVLDDKDKAMALYEKLFIDFSASTFAILARKKFRALRGDEL